MANCSLTWLGHASFRLDTPGGKRVYVDPWLSGPTCPETEKNPDRADVIAITHAHFDHVGDCVELAKRTKAPLVAMVELAGWLEKQGYPDASAAASTRAEPSTAAGSGSR